MIPLDLIGALICQESLNYTLLWRATYYLDSGSHSNFRRFSSLIKFPSLSLCTSCCRPSAFTISACRWNTEFFVHILVIPRVCGTHCPAVLHRVAHTDNQALEINHLRESAFKMKSILRGLNRIQRYLAVLSFSLNLCHQMIPTLKAWREEHQGLWVSL